MSDVETTTAPAEEENVTDKLSNRDALAKAISERNDTAPEPKEEAVPTKTEVAAAVEVDVEPPSEFSAAGKDAWKRKDIAGIQKEYRRVHDSRTQELGRAQKAERDALEKIGPATKLIESVRNYLTLRGDGTIPDEKQVAEAVQLVQALKKDPKGARAELEKIGFDFSGQSAAPKVDDSEIKTLKEQIDALQQKEHARTREGIFNQFDSSFTKLGSEKTRTGAPVFPDLFDTSEKGKQLASDIGSLASDPKFILGVQRRFPDEAHQHHVIVREAYKYLGGRVSDGRATPASVSKANQDIDRKRRAAASTPGSVIANRNGDAQKGKLSNRAALMRALEETREH